MGITNTATGEFSASIAGQGKHEVFMNTTTVFAPYTIQLSLK
jgi:hypothetical protein